jgi:bifunctional non-homologous end joining protein LigD
MLAGGSGVPDDADKYQFEPKLDGQRVIAIVEDGVVTLTNRRGQEATATFPELRGMAGALSGHDVVLDGEVVTFDADGRTSFQRLQRRMHVVQPPAKLLAEVPVVFVAFDVVWYDGEWLVGCPQEERTRILGTLGLKGSHWQTAPVLDATPSELLEACRQAGVEGFMAKRRDAPYLPGKRSSAWSKVKCGRRREFVVGGWSTGQGGRENSIGSLALGVYDLPADYAGEPGRPPRLFYVGQAGSGLREEMIRQLDRLFAQIAIPTSPFVNVPPLKLHYVRPMLVVEVAYTEVTEGGTLRQPSIKGLRTDVVAQDIVADDEIRKRLTPTSTSGAGPLTSG